MFGFLGKGDMTIEIDKYNFTYGDMIQGKAKLKLKKPQDARGVFIGILAEKKTVQYTSKGSNTRWDTVFDFKEPLDGEKTYGTSPYEYDFEIKVPQAQEGKAPQGWLGGAAQAMQFLAGRSSSVRWYLIAKLDMSGRDVSKKVQINVG